MNVDIFAQHGADVASGRRTPPEKLVGPIATRADARRIYAEIVAELSACEDVDALDCYLMTIGEELLQFEAQLDFLWSGDGDDFAGLYAEITNAKSRVSGGDAGERGGAFRQYDDVVETEN